MRKNSISLFFALLTAMSLPSVLFSEQFDFEKNIEKIGDGFYRGKIQHNDYQYLWCVMERIEPSSTQQKYWQEYALSQVKNEAEVMNRWAESEKKENQGARYFELVLNNKYPETWVSYVTSDKDPQPTMMDKNHIKMYMSVVSSKEALITSHMGISITVESITKKPARGISLSLHSFAAKVMLMENPERRFMINSPLVDMAVILIKSGLKKLFIGNQSKAEELFGKNYYDANNSQVVDTAFDDYAEKDKAHQMAEIDDAANNVLELYNNKLENAKNSDEDADISEILNALAGESRAGRYLEIDEVNKKLAIDNQKTAVLKNKIKNNKKFVPDLPIYSLQDKLGLIKQPKKYYTFWMEHRGIVERDGQKLYIEDPENRGNTWLTIDKKNKTTYSWLFSPIFADVGGVGFFAIDLRELAEYGKLATLSEVEK